MWEVSKLLYDRDVYTDLRKNSRGDEVTASMDTNSMPYQITITARPVRAWFSTELITATSNAYSVGLKWRGNDLLEVQLDLGPNATHSPPVTHLGSITVLYRWGGPDAPPPEADIDPYVSCPAPYASAYYAQCEPETPVGSGR